MSKFYNFLEVVGIIGASGCNLESVQNQFKRFTDQSLPLYVYISSQGGIIRVMHAIGDLIKSYQGPTIAIVTNFAYSSGCVLTTFCDRLVATTDAEFLIHSANVSVSNAKPHKLLELTEVLMQANIALLNQYATKVERSFANDSDKERALNKIKSLIYGADDLIQSSYRMVDLGLVDVVNNELKVSKYGTGAMTINNQLKEQLTAVLNTCSTFEELEKKYPTLANELKTIHAQMVKDKEQLLFEIKGKLDLNHESINNILDRVDEDNLRAKQAQLESELNKAMNSSEEEKKEENKEEKEEKSEEKKEEKKEDEEVENEEKKEEKKEEKSEEKKEDKQEKEEKKEEKTENKATPTAQPHVLSEEETKRIIEETRQAEVLRIKNISEIFAKDITKDESFIQARDYCINNSFTVDQARERFNEVLDEFNKSEENNATSIEGIKNHMPATKPITRADALAAAFLLFGNKVRQDVNAARTELLNIVRRSGHDETATNELMNLPNGAEFNAQSETLRLAVTTFEDDIRNFAFEYANLTPAQKIQKFLYRQKIVNTPEEGDLFNLMVSGDVAIVSTLFHNLRTLGRNLYDLTKFNSLYTTWSFDNLNETKLPIARHGLDEASLNAEGGDPTLVATQYDYKEVQLQKYSKAAQLTREMTLKNTGFDELQEQLFLIESSFDNALRRNFARTIVNAAKSNESNKITFKFSEIEKLFKAIQEKQVETFVDINGDTIAGGFDTIICSPKQERALRLWMESDYVPYIQNQTPNFYKGMLNIISENVFYAKNGIHKELNITGNDENALYLVSSTDNIFLCQLGTSLINVSNAMEVDQARQIITVSSHGYFSFFVAHPERIIKLVPENE